MKTVDCFIKKFEAIPENEWCTDTFVDDEGKKCAFGHCGAGQNTNGRTFTPESLALDDLFHEVLGRRVPTVNDGRDAEFQQPTAKQRILAALRYIKEKQCSSSAGP